MDAGQHLAHLRADASALLAAVAAAPEAPVPSCPGWDRRTLLKHLCVPYGWVLAQIEAGPDERRGFRDAERPSDDEDLLAFYDRQTDRLVGLLVGLDPASIWPTWAGPRPVGWFARRMAHETAVHRWDGAAGAVDADFAVDGIDELLELFGPLAAPDRLAEVDGTIHLHATDDGLVDGEWLVGLRPTGVTVAKEHAKGDVAIRGAAGDLYLWAWNRLPLDDRFEVFGDEALAGRWAEVMRI